MTKHTPGPWKINVSPDDRPYIMAGDAYIAKTYRTCYTAKRGEIELPGLANAELIARAPDLLAENERLRAALLEAKDLIMGKGLLKDGHRESVMKQIRNALARSNAK